MDVPVVAAHRVEDHINALTHFVFTLANGWGFGKCSLKLTPVTETVMNALKKSWSGWQLSCFVCVCFGVGVGGWEGEVITIYNNYKTVPSNFFSAAKYKLELKCLYNKSKVYLENCSVCFQVTVILF